MPSFMFRENFEGKLVVQYRRKGEVDKSEFGGSIHILGEDKESLTHVDRKEIPLNKDGVLDLTRVPVITIGGKSKWRPSKIREFLAANPGFEGVFLCWAGSGNWDLDSGDLIFTSRALLEGKRASGGKPIVEWVNPRWDDKGNFLQDKARTLHGKVIETLEVGVIHLPDPELLAATLADYSEGKKMSVSGYLRHPLKEKCAAVSSELWNLHQLSVMMNPDKQKWYQADIYAALVAKFKAAGVQKLSDIPADLAITAEEIAPELCAKKDAVGKVEIPGIGFKTVVGWAYDTFHGAPYLNLTPEEIRQITNWPHTNVLVQIPEAFSASDLHQWHYHVRSLLMPEKHENFGTDEERWQKIREALAKIWDEKYKKNVPEPKALPHPKDQDLPATPEPLVYGEDLLTGVKKVAYPAVCHEMLCGKGRISDKGWVLKYFVDDAEKAAEDDKNGREDAKTHVHTRQLRKKLEAGELSKESVIENYGGHFRRMGMSGNCDHWVVQPDGSLREADNISYRKDYRQEGDKTWSLVGPEELILSWSKSCSADAGTFTLVELPSEDYEVTESQKATASRLSMELCGEPDGWDLEVE